MSQMKEIGVAVLGFGTVGAGVVETLRNNGGLLGERLGLRLVLRGVADLDVTTDRGVAIDPANPGADNPLALGPAGTAHMTLADYGRFLAVFLSEGGGWISADSVARLTAPAEGPPPGYGCGWIVQGQGPQRVLGHEGSNTMWHAGVLVRPEQNRAVLAVSNDHDAGSRAVQDLMVRLNGLP